MNPPHTPQAIHQRDHLARVDGKREDDMLAVTTRGVAQNNDSLFYVKASQNPPSKTKGY